MTSRQVDKSGAQSQSEAELDPNEYSLSESYRSQTQSGLHCPQNCGRHRHNHNMFSCSHQIQCLQNQCCVICMKVSLILPFFWNVSFLVFCVSRNIGSMGISAVCSSSIRFGFVSWFGSLWFSLYRTAVFIIFIF